MSWLCKKPGHQQPWYLLYWTELIWSLHMKDHWILVYWLQIDTWQATPCRENQIMMPNLLSLVALQVVMTNFAPTSHSKVGILRTLSFRVQLMKKRFELWCPVYSPHKGIIMWRPFPCNDIIVWTVYSLWPSDVIWRQGSRSTLAQVMAWCLMAPSHYLNRCWPMISEVLWHSPDSNFTENTEDIYHWNEFQMC